MKSSFTVYFLTQYKCNVWALDVTVNSFKVYFCEAGPIRGPMFFLFFFFLLSFFLVKWFDVKPWDLPNDCGLFDILLTKTKPLFHCTTLTVHLMVFPRFVFSFFLFINIIIYDSDNSTIQGGWWGGGRGKSSEWVHQANSWVQNNFRLEWQV